MNYTILLVDDEPQIIDINRRYLIQAGYQVHTANNGQEALKLYRQHPIDLIISDIMMPEMDGYDVISEVLQDKEDQVSQLKWPKWIKSTRLVLGQTTSSPSPLVHESSSYELPIS